jgi:hypothetical protein
MDRPLRAIIVASQHKSVPTAVSRKFECKHCPATYVTSRQLGGHTSRAHPGSSKDYLLKLKVRERRKPEREAHEKAKLLFQKQTGLNPNENRTIVKKLKETLMTCSKSN